MKNYVVMKSEGEFYAFVSGRLYGAFRSAKEAKLGLLVEERRAEVARKKDAEK